MLNVLAMSHFGFQRDEMLHLTLGDHLAWGYKEVPPFIAVLARISMSVFGMSVFATRIFSTIFSGLLIWFTGLIVVELGGRKFAIALACLALIFSPAFAASGYLFQPVIFDQLWWVLTVFLLVKYLNTAAPKYMYLLGVAIGLGLLTKYTMAFFAIALIVGLLFTKQRRVLWSRHTLIAFLIATIIFLPNLIWQFTHHLPIVTHMSKLRAYQLDYIKPSDFILEQLYINGIALFVWLIGFGFLLFSPRIRKFQFLAFAYILIFIFLLKMNGKVYYIFGAYPMLFAAGGYGFERWIKGKAYVLRTAAILLFTVPNMLLLPMALPFLPLNQTIAFIKTATDKVPAIKFAVKWEDLKYHPLTQDYADMLGWDELAKKTADAYHALPPDQQKQTGIYADNYGEAGAMHCYGKQYNLPDVASLNSSFTLWAPDTLRSKYLLYIDEDHNVTTRLKPFLINARKVGEITNPYAREVGTEIYFIEPKLGLNNIYSKERLVKLAE